MASLAKALPLTGCREEIAMVIETAVFTTGLGVI